MPFHPQRSDAFAMQRYWTARLWRPYERQLASPGSLSRRLCVAAVTAAFVIGIGVGILLPLYVPPSYDIADRTSRVNASKTDSVSADRLQPLESSASPGRDAGLPGSQKDPERGRVWTPQEDKVRALALGHTSRNRVLDSKKLPVLSDLLRKFNPVSIPPTNATSPKPSRGSLEDLVDGVYWSESVERFLPPGYSSRSIADWTSFAENATVVRVAEGCGRMQNRLLVFENGSKSCCRYRQNNDQIQGEIFSFYLAQLLGLRGLPPATLGLLHGREGQWRTVRGQLTLAQWNEQKPVVMTQFVDDLVPAHIPRHFRGDGEQRRLHPVPEDLEDQAPDALRELAQWSDLVVFDYLTANLDRVVNNMYNKQWNPDMMSAPAHNLAKVAHTGLLVFLDNESGLLHGYRLLDKYESYHRAMLEGLCVFRRATARAVLTLHYAGDVGQRLKLALMESQPQMAEWLPLLPDKSVKILRERLARVAQQILMCENRFMNASSTTDSNLVESQDLYDSLTRPTLDSS